MTIHNILKRYRYIIITNKSHIEPLFKLLATDEYIRWRSGCDMNYYDKEMEYIFKYHPQAYIELDLNEQINGDIHLSYNDFWHTNYKTFYKPHEYITSQDLLTASKKSIIILNNKNF